MTDFFNIIYTNIPTKNNFWNRIRFYSLLRFATRIVANAILPIYFKLTANNSKYRLYEINEKGHRLIVSFTSFPARITKVWLAVETILRQSVKPDMIILWLSKEQFPSLTSLPKSLLKLQRRGLQIKLRDEDLRSYKKFYYTLIEYPNDIMITVDDDIFYYSKTIEILARHSKEYPNCVIGTICRKTKFDGNRNLLPYTKWTIQEKEEKSSLISAIGAGGILYPPHVLDENATNKKIFTEICPLADDIWLYFMTIINHNICIKVPFPIKNYLPIIIRKNIRLTTTNDGELENDRQIKNVYDYCKNTLKSNPFK